MRAVRTWRILAAAALWTTACSGGSAATGDDANLTQACSGAHFDTHGICRDGRGRFAAKACCAEAKVTADVFAADFRDALPAWYGNMGGEEEVVATGGNTIEKAQAAVDPSKVEEVTDSDDDPHGHSLEDFIVLSHPDVVFEGSDVVWFGAYDRRSGELDEVYDFN